jgi:hypothetical protein
MAFNFIINTFYDLMAYSISHIEFLKNSNLKSFSDYTFKLAY